MKASKSLRKSLEKVRRYCDLCRYDKAFAEVDRLVQQWPHNPHVLVMWANLLQLQKEDTGPPLAEAKKALQRAVDLDEHGPMPLIELGHFLYALEDNARAASKCFDKAISLGKRLLKDALLGKAKALNELGRRAKVLACLAEAYWLESHNGKEKTDGQDILNQLEELQKMQ